MEDVTEAADRRLDAAVDAVQALQGGMIGEVYRLDLADGRSVVAKRSDTPLTVEADMLRYLDDHGLPVPDVLAADDDLLVLEYVAGDTSPTPAGERAIADALAALHGHTSDEHPREDDASADSPAFGFERDTLLGPLALPNPWTGDWIEFFREQRLCHFGELARDREAVGDDALERIGALADDLDAILTEPDAPALLHGDVWRENVLTRAGEVTAFLDPACYYGHPEEELAYVAWSGAYGDAFFERYREHRSIEPGFDDRRRAYDVPRILVHAICFGEPYQQRLATALDELGY